MRDGGDIVELGGDMLLVHPGLNVSDPERLALLLLVDVA